MFVSRGLRGRRDEDVDLSRVPPGQYVTRDFPVLSAGPTPRTRLEEWTFSVVGEVDEPRRWSCGPTGFVETVAAALVELGHDPAGIRTERFGASGPR